MKKTILVVIFLILFSSFVTAVKPITSITSDTDTGFEINYPLIFTLKQNQAYEFGIHVFNKTNGRPIIKGIECYFHLYNYLTGNHQAELKDNTVGHQFDYSFPVSANNFTELGTYYFDVQCNNSNRGGFASEQFEVTSTGKEQTAVPLLSFILLIFLIIAFLLYLVKNFNVDIFESNGAIKIFFVLLSFWLLLLPFYGFILFNEYFGLLALSTILWRVWPYLIWINIGLTFYFMMYFIIKMLRSLYEK